MFLKTADFQLGINVTTMKELSELNTFQARKNG